MNWKTLLLLVVAIALIASGIAIHIIVKPKQSLEAFAAITPSNLSAILGELPTSNAANLNVIVIPTTKPLPLYAQLWFVPLMAGVAILSFLGGRKSKL